MVESSVIGFWEGDDEFVRSLIAAEDSDTGCFESTGIHELVKVKNESESVVLSRGAKKERQTVTS